METKREVFSNQLKDFPQSELWRLFIDGHRQNEGPLTFDVKEKGYLKGCLNAFGDMMSHIHDPVTTNLILKLHNTALKAVDDNARFDAINGIDYKGSDFNFRDGPPTSFGIVLNNTVDNQFNESQLQNLQKKANLSIDGLHELLAIMKSHEGKFIELERSNRPIDVSMPFDKLVNIIHSGNCAIFLKKDTFEHIQDRINSSIGSYYHAIKSARSDDGKLSAIITFVKELELNHYFSDANCRTTVCLLMNKLLMENGFSPAIHENPNRVDGYSTKELMLEVKNGMEKFKEFTLSNHVKIDLKKIKIDNTSTKDEIKYQISDLFKNDPLCALAQVNHLHINIPEYFDVKAHKIPMIASLMEKTEKNINKIGLIKEALAEVYADKLKECLEKNPKISAKNFSDIMANHKIFNESPVLISTVSRALSDHTNEVRQESLRK
jgi:hypothetical protein